MLKRLNFLYVLFVPLTIVLVLLVANIDLSPKSCSPMGINGIAIVDSDTVYAQVKGGGIYRFSWEKMSWDLVNQAPNGLGFGDKPIQVTKGTHVDTWFRIGRDQTTIHVEESSTQVTNTQICNNPKTECGPKTAIYAVATDAGEIYVRPHTSGDHVYKYSWIDSSWTEVQLAKNLYWAYDSQLLSVQSIVSPTPTPSDHAATVVSKDPITPYSIQIGVTQVPFCIPK